MDVISNFAARYERTREEVLSLQDYLDICKRDATAYASASERMLKAIGEPQQVDTRNDPRLSRIFANKVIKNLSGLQGVLRHGGRHRAGGVVLPSCRAGPGRKEADPVFAGPRGRRQEFDRRAPEAAHGARALLRHPGLARERIAARAVRHHRRRPKSSKKSTAFRAATSTASSRPGP